MSFLRLLKNFAYTIAVLLALNLSVVVLYLQTETGSQNFVKCVNEGKPSIMCAMNKWSDSVLGDKP